MKKRKTELNEINRRIFATDTSHTDWRVFRIYASFMVVLLCLGGAYLYHSYVTDSCYQEGFQDGLKASGKKLS